jgi:hypothetical protein
MDPRGGRLPGPDRVPRITTEVTTRIVFGGGAELEVRGDAEHVDNALGRGRSGLARLETTAGSEVYINASQVAYIEPAETATGA